MNPFAQLNPASRWPVSVRSIALALAFAPAQGLPLRAAAIEPAPARPLAHVVTRGALDSTLRFEAAFEPASATPLRLEPRAWSDLTVLEAAAHGSRVRKGDLLLRLDTRKLRDEIDALDRKRPASETALAVARAELEHLESTTPHRLEAAHRALRVAEEDLHHFRESGRPDRERLARFRVRGAEQRLENAAEELKQLEKMYLADDLTEETEEIILKRQRFEVEAARLALESTRLHTERELTVFIPREHDSLRIRHRDESAALALAESTLPRALARKRLDVDQLRHDRELAERRLKELHADLESFEVRAPHDGIVYHGPSENGRWTQAQNLARKLVPGGKLAPSEIFITLVEPAPLHLIATLTEPQLAQARPWLRGEAVPVSAPDRRLPVTLESIHPVPLPGGGFEARLSVPASETGRFVPGLLCKVTLPDAPKPGVLLAPRALVFGDGASRHVWRDTGTGAPQKHAVTIGESDATHVEIVEGLSEGDRLVPAPAE